MCIFGEACTPRLVFTSLLKHPKKCAYLTKPARLGWCLHRYQTPNTTYVFGKACRLAFLITLLKCPQQLPYF